MFKNLNFQIDETNTVIFTICTNQPLQQIYIITSSTNLYNKLVQPTSTNQPVQTNLLRLTYYNQPVQPTSTSQLVQAN